ncbi:MAG: hypothetical protein HWN66_11730 [Candidatus Helarchaeota archaeon]|nr:hypothetical protein [Candidatus Helarchaeota archaeon]
MPISTDPGVWLGAFLVIGIYTYLINDNKYFQIAEHLVIGAITAHSFVIAIQYIRDTVVFPVFEGNVEPLIPLILGAMLFLRYFVGYNWLTRYPLAILVGLGTGVALRAVIKAQLIGQLLGVLNPLVVPGDALTTVSRILVLIGVISTLVYYTFTREHTGLFGYVAKFGRTIMMVTFGAALTGQFISRSLQIIVSLNKVFIELLFLG